MTREQLFAAIGETDETLLAESEHLKKRSPRRRWFGIAACIALLLTGSIQGLLRMEYLTAGCGAWPGDIVDGVYYYRVPHKGFCRYTPDEGSELLVHTLFEDGCLVNEYGVYFTVGRSVYVRAHETEKFEKLYTVPLFSCSHIGISLMGDGSVDLTVYNKWQEWRYDLQLNGKTGEVLATLMEKTAYGEDYIQPWRQHYLVGTREIEKVKLSRELTDAVEQEFGLTFHERLCDLTENGVSLLPEGAYTGDYSGEYLGDYLLMDYFYPEDLAKTHYAGDRVLLVAPDGSTVDLPPGNYDAASEGYLYHLEYDRSEVMCYELASGEEWALPIDREDLNGDLYDFASDGTLLYSSAPWAEEQVCWEIVRDESGKPRSLRLLSEDISAE